MVNLKAQVLESDVFPDDQNSFEDDFEITEQPWINNNFDIPQYPEKYLRRRSVSMVVELFQNHLQNYFDHQEKHQIPKLELLN